MKFGTMFTFAPSRNASVVSEKSFISGGNQNRISMRPLSAIFAESADMKGVQQPNVVNLDSIAEQDPLPPHADVEEALNMVVLDQHRLKIPFAQLLQDTDERRTVTIFIRHFFCGVCIGGLGDACWDTNRSIELFRIRSRTVAGARCRKVGAAVSQNPTRNHWLWRSNSDP